MSVVGPKVLEPRLKQREFVAFRIAGQEFALDIMSVREIRGWTPTTQLPESPDYVKGVVNLRGAVLPILDLAVRLGFHAAEPTSRHAIIVVQIGERVVGLLVDGVSEIMGIDDVLVQPVPAIGSLQSAGALEGVMAAEGRMIGLLSLATMLPPSEPAWSEAA